MRFLASLLIIACENNDLRRSAMKLGLLVKVRTGKLDANAAVSGGCYPFFTCSKEVSEIDTYAYDCECVLVAGNGDLNVKYYNGKFNAYQRTYIVERASSEINMRYLYHFLSCYVDVLRRQSIGGVIKYIKLGNLTEADIKLPDKETQERISMILDRLTHLISLRQRQAEKLDELVKARFVEMFGEGKYGGNPLSNVCKLITDGTHQPPQFVDAGIPFLLVSNLVHNEITYDTEKFISKESYQELIKRTPVEIGDILLSIVGSYGHAGVVRTDKPFCFQRHIAYIKPDFSKLNSEFLHYALLSDAVKYQMEKRVKGIAQKTLNLSELKKIVVPIPPLALQTEFSHFVHEVDREKERIQRSAALLETLKRSLMQQYFG